MTIPYFKALLTPLKNDTEYGDEIDISADLDITNYIKKGKLGVISTKIDAEDYDIGLFTYGKVRISAINFDGKFNGSKDWRSIFYHKRDRAKIKIVYVDKNGEEHILFKGLLNEDFAQVSEIGNEANFDFIAYDSILRKVRVVGGLISRGISFKSAISNILNREEIRSVVGFNSDKINLAYDGIVDDPLDFNENDTRTALNKLLFAANSVAFVDSDDEWVVKSRKEFETFKIITTEDGEPLATEDGKILITEGKAGLHRFHGGGDLYGRQNIIKIKSYSDGLNRVFNSIKINNTTVVDDASIKIRGLRKREQQLGFINNATTEREIAKTILTEFKYPRPECEIIVKTDNSLIVNLLEQASINYPYYAVPADNRGLPMSGYIANEDLKVIAPYLYGNLKISERYRWKVLGITHNSAGLQTVLKLRMIGNSETEGVVKYG